ncbi:uncharacterized protein LOC124434386 [Xenia sp. Carnegie-2017]|uniref:uncharacterized protein LOC124434386 n=1 Tax=Xenia sp. Carnegie-2017 TaxID=2897299 RepID=UPI001F04E496|nr:uncharacterized protein LOC124434386 [Xenia sp. Carnegie-2017]
MAVREMSVWLSEASYENEPMNAFVYRAKIIEVGRLCRSIGDQLSESNVEHYQNENLGLLVQYLKALVETLNLLERESQSEKLEPRETELILRGLYNLTELGNNALIFLILEIACAFLNMEKDPFPEEGQYIMNCLENVKEHQATIESLIKDASRLLEEMLDSENFGCIVGREFDEVVRKAKIEIELCSRRLNGAEKAINKLAEKMNIIKWVSRGMRTAGFAFSSCVLYKRYQESSQSLFDLLQFGGLTLLIGNMWMFFFGVRPSVFYESIPKLEAQHRLLKEKLNDLRKSLIKL